MVPPYEELLACLRGINEEQRFKDLLYHSCLFQNRYETFPRLEDSLKAISNKHRAMFKIRIALPNR